MINSIYFSHLAFASTILAAVVSQTPQTNTPENDVHYSVTLNKPSSTYGTPDTVPQPGVTISPVASCSSSWSDSRSHNIYKDSDLRRRQIFNDPSSSTSLGTSLTSSTTSSSALSSATMPPSLMGNPRGPFSHYNFTWGTYPFPPLTRSISSANAEAPPSVASSASTATAVAIDSPNTRSLKIRTVVIVAGVVGGLLTLFGIFFYVRRRRQLKNGHVQTTRRMKRGRLTYLMGGASQSSETSQERGEAHSNFVESGFQDSCFHEKSGIRPASSLVANATSRNSRSIARKNQQANSSEPIGPEISIAPTNMLPSLSQTPVQPIQEDNQLGPTDDSSENWQSVPTDVNPASDESSSQAVSLIIQEMNELRTQMAEVVRRQQTEASRGPHSMLLYLNEGDDSRTAPPAYSDGG